ncbi:MAG: hypothetical protein KDD50_05670 [Bdellovibrionales bacterium]|nr:hypothetical protein [Bdellovibrionales bacterium]
MIKKIILLFLILTSPYLFAGQGEGVSAQGNFGLPSSQITNPDGSTAFYSGIGLKADLSIPLYTPGGFATAFRLNIKYLDLQNSANSSSQRETGNHIGGGAGLKLNFYRIFMTYDFNVMKARHFFVGDINHYLEYDYNSAGYSVGLEFSTSKTFSGVISYSINSGNIPKAATGFTSDSSYSDSLIWIGVKYKTGLPFGKFLESIFK